MSSGMERSSSSDSTSSSSTKRDQFIDLYDAVYRSDLSNIPVDAVGPAGTTFGDDYQVHRSVGDLSGGKVRIGIIIIGCMDGW